MSSPSLSTVSTLTTQSKLSQNEKFNEKRLALLSNVSSGLFSFYQPIFLKTSAPSTYSQTENGHEGNENQEDIN